MHYSIYQKAFQRYLRTGLPVETQIKEVLNQTRQYIWVTQGDDKVRPSHAAREGQIFSATSASKPGQEPRCRCSALPLDHLIDPYPDAIEPVYPELLLPAFRFVQLFSQLYRAIRGLDDGQTLTAEQANNLRRFDAKLPKDAQTIQILSGPNGQRIFRSDVPARNIPGSFARYEKVVDTSGNTLSYTKTTYAPDGSIVHIKAK